MLRFLSLIFFLSPSLYAEPVKKIVLFGDSLSDQHSLYERSLNYLPKKPYWNGRFSDGPVWAEVAFPKLHIPVKNLAIAGMATSLPYKYAMDESFWFKLYLRFREYLTLDMSQILTEHLNEENNEPSENLYVFFMGSVNYLTVADMGVFKNAYQDKKNYILKSYADETVRDIRKAIDELYEAGARRFVLLNLPNLYRLPNDDPKQRYAEGILGLFGELHNQALVRTQKELKREYPEAQVLVYSTYELFEKLYKSPSNYGFSVFNASCYQGGWSEWDKVKFPLCSQPNQHVFFDPYHPSKRAHCTMSWDFAEFLAKQKLLGLKPISESRRLEMCRR